MPGTAQHSALPAVRTALTKASDVVAVTQPRISPSGKVAVMEAYPNSAPQAAATTNLVNRLREQVFPRLQKRLGVALSIGGFTAGSIDFSHVLTVKLPLFIAIVVVLSALLLLVIFRSVVIPIQAAVMNLLSIGGALGATVAVFQWGWGSSVLGISSGPIEPWIPVLMFAVVFGLSMDYEVFLISRVREEWVHKGDAAAAVADGIAFTGRVITAAAAIMVCVFLSFMLGDERSIKEFGFGLAVAVFLDALVVRCVMLPAVLELLGADHVEAAQVARRTAAGAQHRGLLAGRPGGDGRGHGAAGAGSGRLTGAARRVRPAFAAAEPSRGRRWTEAMGVWGHFCPQTPRASLRSRALDPATGGQQHQCGNCGEASSNRLRARARQVPGAAASACGFGDPGLPAVAEPRADRAAAALGHADRARGRDRAGLSFQRPRSDPRRVLPEP